MRKGAGRALVRRLTPCHTAGSVSRTANSEHHGTSSTQHHQQHRTHHNRHGQQPVGSRP